MPAAEQDCIKWKLFSMSNKLLLVSFWCALRHCPQKVCHYIQVSTFYGFMYMAIYSCELSEYKKHLGFGDKHNCMYYEGNHKSCLKGFGDFSLHAPHSALLESLERVFIKKNKEKAPKKAHCASIPGMESLRDKPVENSGTITFWYKYQCYLFHATIKTNQWKQTGF